MPGRFGSDHRNVDGGRRLDSAKANVEAVREHQRFARLEVWLDGVVIELRLLGVRSENHDDVGPGGGLGGRVDGQAFFFRFGAGGARFWKADADGDATVTQVQ